MDRPGFDPMDALAQQLQLLERKRRHVEGLISLARGILEKGAWSMDFQAFDTKALEQYKAEAKGKWGHTKAYMEFVQKKEADIAGATQALMGLFQALGAMQSLPPAHELVQEKTPGPAKPYHPGIFIPAPRRSCKGWGRCIRRTPAFGRTSTGPEALARRRSYSGPSRPIAKGLEGLALQT